MNKIIHRAGDRGAGEYGWLSTRYSFSFSDWYDATRMGFGALRVINDDRIAGKRGFGMHQHRDMEIITIVTSGMLSHKDSMGNIGTVRAGEVQVMSAGTGVAHSEYNDTEEELSLFQIWIQPNVQGSEPRYAQRAFEQGAGLLQVVGPMDQTDVLSIQQDAYISLARVDKDASLTYTLNREGNGVYVLMMDGEVVIDGEVLGPRDAVGIEDAVSFEAVSSGEANLLVIEVPMR